MARLWTQSQMRCFKGDRIGTLQVTRLILFEKMDGKPMVFTIIHRCFLSIFRKNQFRQHRIRVFL